MKEIKVRAWQKSVGRMWSWVEILQSGYLQAILTGVYLEPMQYTGRKDTDGVDIYAGDFVTSFYLIEQNGEVKQAESGEWYLDYGDGEVMLQTELRRYACKVTGNIYENPELMKGGSDV